MEELTENEDYYWEGQMMVLTRRFHLKRGHCCGSGCRHCPYDPKGTKGTKGTTTITPAEQQPNDCDQ